MSNNVNALPHPPPYYRLWGENEKALEPPKLPTAGDTITVFGIEERVSVILIAVGLLLWVMVLCCLGLWDLDFLRSGLRLGLGLELGSVLPAIMRLTTAMPIGSLLIFVPSSFSAPQIYMSIILHQWKGYSPAVSLRDQID